MANVKPKGKWSKDFDSCRNCATNLIPHKADGLCNRCYLWAYRQGLRGGFVTTRTSRGEIKRTRGEGKQSKRKRSGGK